MQNENLTWTPALATDDLMRQSGAVIALATCFCHCPDSTPERGLPWGAGTSVIDLASFILSLGARRWNDIAVT
jgi:hypothetical protein